MNAIVQVHAAANAVVSSKTTSPHRSYPMEHKKLPHRGMFVHWFTPPHRPLPRLFRQRRVDRRTQDDCADALCPSRASARTQAHRLVVSAEHLFSADEIRVAGLPKRANQLTRSHAHPHAHPHASLPARIIDPQWNRPRIAPLRGKFPTLATPNCLDLRSGCGLQSACATIPPRRMR